MQKPIRLAARLFETDMTHYNLVAAFVHARNATGSEPNLRFDMRWFWEDMADKKLNAFFDASH